MRLKPDWFLIGMAGAVALAWILPGPGADGGALHPAALTKMGIALIFFLHGLALSSEAMKAGAKRWKIHLIVQGCTFLFFPLIGWILLKTLHHLWPEALGLGFFYLCALPSTVSSSVAMTAAARGNVAAAVFNATLSSLIGIVLTPLWMGIAGRSGAHGMPLGEVVLGLVAWLLLPLLLGQALRPWLGGFAARHKRWLAVADRGTILLLVYTSFCDSVKWGVWSGHGAGLLGGSLFGALLLFSTVLGSTLLACRLLGFDRPDTAATVFCGSKKSLATGIPMARLMFPGDPSLGLILLPIMIYHPLQLFLCGMLAAHWAKKAASPHLSPNGIDS